LRSKLRERERLGGAEKSVFGEKRVVTLKSLGLVARIIVSKAVTSPVSVGGYQLDSIDLQIEVDNSAR